MLIVILEWRGGAIGFAKWKCCPGSIILTMGACFPRQRPDDWPPGAEGGWRAEVGMRRGRKPEPTPLLWAQAGHWSHRAPRSGRDLTGLRSNFGSISLLPWPLETVLHASTADTFAREDATVSKANASPGSPLPRVPSDESRPRKEGLASLRGVWIPRKPQNPGSAGLPSCSHTEMVASWWILTWGDPVKRPLASQNPKRKEGSRSPPGLVSYCG